MRVKAEAIVFLDYSKDFPHMQQGGIIGWQSSAVVSQAVLAGAKSFANMARSFAKKPEVPREPRKVELSARTVIVGAPRKPSHGTQLHLPSHGCADSRRPRKGHRRWRHLGS
jgi:hypothetical protein